MERKRFVSSFFTILPEEEHHIENLNCLTMQSYASPFRESNGAESQESVCRKKEAFLPLSQH